MKNKKLISVLIIFIGLLATLAIVFSIPSCTSKEEAISKTVDLEQSKITQSDETNYPTYHGFVNDYTGTLSEEWKAKTEQLTASVEKETSCEIAVGDLLLK